MEIKIIQKPDDERWMGVKQRALVTIGKEAKIIPSFEWKENILKAMHSPIRYLEFSFYLKDIPYFVSVHLVRHVHSQPYVLSQRNDRQDIYDREKAPQDAPVDMIWDVNAEELITICHKRLCNKASNKTREVIEIIKEQVIEALPEFKEVLVPMCKYRGGICTEFYPCGQNKK